MITEISAQGLAPQLLQQWNSALKAAELNNYEYVLTLLKPIVKEAPGFLEGRKLLRTCEGKLAGGKGAKKGGLLGGLRLGVSRKDPQQALAALEDELEKDPYSIATNEALYDVAMSQEFPALAAFALETIRAGHPENVKQLHKLAAHYLAQNQPALAVPVFRDILKVAPADSVAVKGDKDATARASMQEQKWEEAKDFRQVLKNANESAELDKSDKLGVTKDELEARLATLSESYNRDTTNLAVVRAIASVYEQMDDWGNAQSFYSYAFELSHNDVSLEKKASEMYAKAMDKYIKELEAMVAANPESEELRGQLEEARSNQAQTLVAECERQVEANPTDPQLRFDLGQALFASGKFTEAIPQLQRARTNPHLRIRAMLMLGKCYEAKSMNDMAVKQLEEANAELQIMDATKKDILYTMGQIYLKMGNKEKAIDSLKLIYDADYGYRDVAQIVEGSYQ